MHKVTLKLRSIVLNITCCVTFLHFAFFLHILQGGKLPLMPPCASTSSWLLYARTGTFCRMRRERQQGLAPWQFNWRDSTRQNRCVHLLALHFSATWWECSTGRSACWRTASNLCMCLTASPRSSNHQRSVRVLWLPVGHFAIVSACKILKKLLRRINFWRMFTLCLALVCLQLEKRGERRAEAEKQLAKAQEAGESLCSSHSIQQSFWIRTLWIQSLTRDLLISFSYFPPQNKTFPQLSCVCVITGEQENIDKFTKRLVKVTKQHNDECKKLLALMGVPFVEVQTCCPFCTCASQLEGIRSEQLAFFFFLGSRRRAKLRPAVPPWSNLGKSLPPRRKIWMDSHSGPTFCSGTWLPVKQSKCLISDFLIKKVKNNNKVNCVSACLTFEYDKYLCIFWDFKSITLLFFLPQETSNSGIPLGSDAAGHRPYKRTSKAFPPTDPPLECRVPFAACIHFLFGLPVHRPLHSARLRLLRHHQGDRPQTGHRPHQAARLHRGNPRQHRPERT